MLDAILPLLGVRFKLVGGGCLSTSPP